MTTNITNQIFRSAMGSFTTGICILGAKRKDGARIGITVNSFSSVSLEPPLILACLGANTARTSDILAAKHFSISILNEDQHSLSRHFAQAGEGLVPDKGWTVGTNGAPLMDEALATLECELETSHQEGDHQIVIGRVTKIETHLDQKPLLYFQGDYHNLGAVTE